MASPSIKPVTLWDPVVRLTHWSIALVVLLNAILTEGGNTLHIWAGWVGMALLILRLIWGFSGPKEARFSAFPPNPRATLSHLADLLAGHPKTYISHNPAGAAMAYALWVSLAVLTVTGLVMTGGKTPMQIDDLRASIAEGDSSVLADDDDEGENDNESLWSEVSEEVHEVAGNLILLLAVLHVAGVVIESRAVRRNLLKPMLTGSRK